MQSEKMNINLAMDISTTLYKRFTDLMYSLGALKPVSIDSSNALSSALPPLVVSASPARLVHSTYVCA